MVGSFTALAWKPGELDGGNIYPFKVRREPKRNLRVWTSDGSEDQEARSGSWPLQNIQLANSLKLMGYDFHFIFGGGTHHAALAASELPECLTWLWRDYDPSKTEQTYEQSSEEKPSLPSGSEFTTVKSDKLAYFAKLPFGSASILYERRSSGAIRRYRYRP